MTKHKPFNKTEMKILVFNKMKNKGMSYDQACKELEKEINAIIENSKKKPDVKKSPDKFKEEFAKLTHG